MNNNNVTSPCSSPRAVRRFASCSVCCSSRCRSWRRADPAVTRRPDTAHCGRCGPPQCHWVGLPACLHSSTRWKHDFQNNNVRHSTCRGVEHACTHEHKSHTNRATRACTYTRTHVRARTRACARTQTKNASTLSYEHNL